jgi:hypothetical protein
MLASQFSIRFVERNRALDQSFSEEPFTMSLNSSSAHTRLAGTQASAKRALIVNTCHTRE